MLIVIVEFVLRPGMQSKFEEELAAMRARVKDFDGFLGEEPCQSVTDAEKQVVLFYWRDEESMATWRSDPSTFVCSSAGATSSSLGIRSASPRSSVSLTGGWVAESDVGLLTALTSQR